MVGVCVISRCLVDIPVLPHCPPDPYFQAATARSLPVKASLRGLVVSKRVRKRLVFVSDEVGAQLDESGLSLRQVGMDDAIRSLASTNLIHFHIADSSVLTMQLRRFHGVGGNEHGD